MEAPASRVWAGASTATVRAGLVQSAQRLQLSHAGLLEKNECCFRLRLPFVEGDPPPERAASSESESASCSRWPIGPGPCGGHGSDGSRWKPVRVVPRCAAATAAAAADSERKRGSR